MKYFMFSHVGIQLFSFLTVMPIQYWITHIPNNPIVPLVQAQPIWLQFIELLIVVDFTTYWLHRAMHEVNFLWRFHAIHHSTEHMDWLASSRLHIVEVLMTRFIATLPIFLLGFNTSAVFAYLIFISFFTPFLSILMCVFVFLICAGLLPHLNFTIGIILQKSLRLIKIMPHSFRFTMSLLKVGIGLLETKSLSIYSHRN